MKETYFGILSRYHLLLRGHWDDCWFEDQWLHTIGSYKMIFNTDTNIYDSFAINQDGEAFSLSVNKKVDSLDELQYEIDNRHLIKMVEPVVTYSDSLEELPMKCNYCGAPIIVKRKTHGGMVVDMTKCQNKECGCVYYYGIERSEG